MTRPDLSVVPYRASDELETLRRENEELRAELQALKEETLYPFAPQINGQCRMCNQGFSKRVKREGADSIVELWGPELTFKPAAPKRWWRKATPARMRRNCKACGALYYEQPFVETEA